MAQAKYRRVPMHQQISEGARVKRVLVPGMVTIHQDLEGTVIGPAVCKGGANWYLPVHWDGTARPEDVHVSRLEWIS